MITSVQNNTIKDIKKLLSKSKERKNKNAYVIEGIRLVEEYQNTGQRPFQVLYDETLQPRGLETVSFFESQDIQCIPVAPHVMNSLSDTKSPQGILAVVPIQPIQPPQALSFVLILDGIQDPGNMGTIIRTAKAANVDLIITAPGCVDIYSPKVIRSTMGAIFRQPIQNLNWQETQTLLEKNHLPLYIAAMQEGQSIYQANLNQNIALLIGGEANGATFEARQIAQDSLHIPMPGAMESLNASIATAIMLFEIVRQKQN